MKSIVITRSITKREYPSLEKYFNDVEKISPITEQEEVLLAKKIRMGDQSAVELLTKSNLRFVISVAKKYQHMGLTLGDLINEGNLGLIIAAKRYDETKGFKFISYAVWWIRQSIIRALTEHGRTVRLPGNKLALLTKLRVANARLEQIHERKASDEELSEHLGVPAINLTELLNESEKALSLDEAYYNVDGFSPMEFLTDNGESPDDKVMFESVQAEINYSMRVLTPREREILILFYGLGAVSAIRLEDIGERYKITKEHAGRVKQRALQKLRNCSSARVLKSCIN